MIFLGSQPLAFHWCKAHFLVKVSAQEVQVDLKECMVTTSIYQAQLRQHASVAYREWFGSWYVLDKLIYFTCVFPSLFYDIWTVVKTLWDTNGYDKAVSTIMSYVLRTCQVLYIFEKASSYSRNSRELGAQQSDSNSTCYYAGCRSYNSKTVKMQVSSFLWQMRFRFLISTMEINTSFEGFCECCGKQHI